MRSSNGSRGRAWRRWRPGWRMRIWSRWAVPSVGSWRRFTGSPSSGPASSMPGSRSPNRSISAWRGCGVFCADAWSRAWAASAWGRSSRRRCWPMSTARAAGSRPGSAGPVSPMPISTAPTSSSAGSVRPGKSPRYWIGNSPSAARRLSTSAICCVRPWDNAGNSPPLSPPAYLEAGGWLPPDWQAIARLADLYAWADFLSRPAAGPALIEDARRIIRETIDTV